MLFGSGLRYRLLVFKCGLMTDLELLWERNVKTCKCCGQVQLWVTAKEFWNKACAAVAAWLDGPPKFKVVGIDNFARENVSDFLIAEGLTKTAAEDMCAEMNKDACDFTNTWYVVRPQNHKLYVFEGWL